MRYEYLRMAAIALVVATVILITILLSGCAGTAEAFLKGMDEPRQTIRDRDGKVVGYVD